MTHPTTVTLPPDQYTGAWLCPCCGHDGEGHRFAICTEGFTHAESCALYTYSDFLCDDCETAIEADNQASMDSEATHE